MKPDPFTPWRAQKRKALQQNMLAGLSGLTAIALPLRLGWRSLWISALLGLLAWVLTRWARINRRHAAARHHGKTVEQRASALAQRILLGEGLMVECNRRVPGLGAAFAFVASASANFPHEAWRDEAGRATAIPAVVGQRAL